MKYMKLWPVLAIVITTSMCLNGAQPPTADQKLEVFETKPVQEQGKVTIDTAEALARAVHHELWLAFENGTLELVLPRGILIHADHAKLAQEWYNVYQNYGHDAPNALQLIYNKLNTLNKADWKVVRNLVRRLQQETQKTPKKRTNNLNTLLDVLNDFVEHNTRSSIELPTFPNWDQPIPAENELQVIPPTIDLSHLIPGERELCDAVALAIDRELSLLPRNVCDDFAKEDAVIRTWSSAPRPQTIFQAIYEDGPNPIVRTLSTLLEYHNNNPAAVSSIRSNAIQTLTSLFGNFQRIWKQNNEAIKPLLAQPMPYDSTRKQLVGDIVRELSWAAQHGILDNVEVVNQAKQIDNEHAPIFQTWIHQNALLMPAKNRTITISFSFIVKEGMHLQEEEPIQKKEPVRITQCSPEMVLTMVLAAFLNPTRPAYSTICENLQKYIAVIRNVIQEKRKYLAVTGKKLKKLQAEYDQHCSALSDSQQNGIYERLVELIKKIEDQQVKMEAKPQQALSEQAQLEQNIIKALKHAAADGFLGALGDAIKQIKQQQANARLAPTQQINTIHDNALYVFGYTEEGKAFNALQQDTLKLAISAHINRAGSALTDYLTALRDFTTSEQERRGNDSPQHKKHTQDLQRLNTCLTGIQEIIDSKTSDATQEDA